MKRVKPAPVAGSSPAKLAMGKRKREPEPQPAPPKRLSRTTNAAAPPVSRTPTQQTQPLPAPQLSDFSELKGFLPLPVRLHPDADTPPATGDSTPQLARYLYYRPHHATASDDDADVPAERTLLVVNVPFYYTGDELSELFQCFGEVEQAVVLSSRATTQHKPPLLLAPLEQSVYETAAVSTGLDAWQPAPPHAYYRSARVIFASAVSVATATSTALAHSLATAPQPHIPPPATQLFGLPLLLAQYRRQRPAVDALRDSADRFMAVFDAQEQARKKAQREAAQDDGWTLVTTKRGSRNSGGAAGSEEERAERLEQARRKEEKRRAAVAGLSFYRFQGAEKKQTQLVELRRKFDEDKAKVAAMRANRRFKPL